MPPADPPHLTRRRFLQAGALAGTGLLLAPGAAPGREAQPKRLAAVNTVYRLRSHAYHIVGRFLHGYRIAGKLHRPPYRVVRMYNDQYPQIDLSRGLAKKFGFELCDTVAGALGGKDGFDVDAVLLIGEHGDYPENDIGQQLYPRYELFEQIVRVFRTSGRGVPVFSDKHLSYDHAKARRMVEWSRELGFGLMAGSSLPVTWRRPEYEPERGTPFTEALVCYGNKSVERYFIHGLETLQCMLERRDGGETGVKSVQCLQGDAVWRAADAGAWSAKLLDAALSRNPSRNIGHPRDNVPRPLALLVEYRDGTRGTVLNLEEHVTDFSFAASIRGREEPVSCCFYLPSPPGARYFDALVMNIEKHFAAGEPPYPVERTLLTGTVLDFAMHSLAADGKILADPALDVRYAPPEDSGFIRGPFTDAGWHTPP